MNKIYNIRKTYTCPINWPSRNIHVFCFCFFVLFCKSQHACASIEIAYFPPILLFCLILILFWFVSFVFLPSGFGISYVVFRMDVYSVFVFKYILFTSFRFKSNMDSSIKRFKKLLFLFIQVKKKCKVTQFLTLFEQQQQIILFFFVLNEKNAN